MPALTVTVTAADIARGERNDDALCPIARAIRHRVGSRSRISVTNETAYVRLCGHDTGHRYLLPPIAAQFIKVFDHGGDVLPITFVLDGDD